MYYELCHRKCFTPNKALFLNPTYLTIDLRKLPSPRGGIKERSKVEPVVVRAVALHVVSWSQDRQLVAIDGIRAEEMLDLLCHLHMPGKHKEEDS